MLKKEFLIGIIITSLLGIVALNLIQSVPNSATLTITPTIESTIPVEQSENTLEKSRETHVETIPPVVLGYLKNRAVTFLCLNSKECFQDIDITRLMNTSWDAVRGREFSLHSIHYINSTGIYIILVKHGTEPQTLILHLNPETNQVNFTGLPIDIQDTLDIVFHGKLAIVAHIVHKTLSSIEIHNVLYIIRSDLSIAQVDLDSVCYPGILVEGMDKKIIVLDPEKINQDGRYYARACIVDVNSGEYTERRFETPFDALGEQEDSRILFGMYSVSPDMGRLYYLYSGGEIEKRGSILGMFDTRTGEESSIYTAQCINMQAGYQQYRDILFSSTECFGDFGTECYGNTTLIRMSDLEPILCKYPESQTRVVPFGDYFLLDNGHKGINLITPNGDNIGQFTFPVELNGTDYRVMEYRK